MKKIIALLLILCSSVGLNAYALSDSFLNINTTATEEYTPNVAEITFSVETKDKNASIATEKNKTISKNVMEILKKQIDTSNGDNIKTGNFNVSPQYYYKDGKSHFENYKVENTFMVKTKDITKIGDLISLALQNGVNEVRNLSFSLENTDTYCTELMGRAAKAAKVRANSIAKAMDSRIKGVKNVSVSCSSENNYGHAPYRNMYMSAKMMDSAAGAETSAVPIEAGILKLNATFNGSFLMK